MTRLLRSAFLALAVGSTSLCCFGQSSSQSSSASAQSGASPSAQPATETTPDGSAAPTASTKKKKVWTNEDVGTLNGPVSVVGSSKKSGTASGDGTAADSQYIANTKKELEKLQTQLDEAKKQLTAFREFQQGKAPEPTGYQLGKGYNRVPVDQQIASLEEKKTRLEEKISDLLDQARKKGVQPGQLR